MSDTEVTLKAMQAKKDRLKRKTLITKRRAQREKQKQERTSAQS